MKTKELIRLLQKEDPEGNLDVCADNIDISDVYRLEAYYDGSQQILIRNEKGQIIGGRYNRTGYKIKLSLLPFTHLVWDNKDINYSDLSPSDQKFFKENHDSIKQASKDCDYELELDCFIKFIKKKADISNELIKEFFDKNLSPYDVISDDIPIIGESYVTRRMKQWERQIEVKSGNIYINKV